MDIGNRQEYLKPNYFTDKSKMAAECQSMEDVRREIDRLDRIIVELLSERQTYIEAAARIKNNRDTVRDTSRIEDVVQKVVAHAQERGLNPMIAEAVWRTLIEQCIAHEYKKFDTEEKN